MSADDSFLERFADVLRTRRTIGSFRPESPPREIILSALELACWAPNHRKTEPWRFTLLGNESVRRIIELNTEIVTAKKGAAEAERKRMSWSAVPGWLLATCVRANDEIQAEEDYAACCCAIQNLLLALWSNGIGTKWSTGGVTRNDRFFEITQINPQVERVVGLIWYGYPVALPEQSRLPLSHSLRELP